MDILYKTPTKLTSIVASSGFVNFPSFSGRRDPFSVIPALANTTSTRPCWEITFSNAAAWLSQLETSTLSKLKPHEGNSERSCSRVVAPVVGLISKIVMWVFGCGANWRVIPSPIPEAPP